MHGGHLRIAILGVNYAPERSGIAPYTTGMARGLAQAGHNVRVFTSLPHYPEWRVPDEFTGGEGTRTLDGVSVTRLAHFIPHNPTGARRARFELAFGARLARANWRDADVVVCVSPALLSSAAAILRGRSWRNRPALGLVVQDLYSRGVTETGMGGGPLSRLATGLESTVARACDGVVAIHDRFKSQIVGRLGVPADRVTVIRNWTHVSTAAEFDHPKFRDAMGWSQSERIILHAGAMGAKQALENVVHAARLADRQETPVKFVLLGDGSRRRELQHAAQGVRSIEFRDSLDDVAFGRALRAADVLLVNEKPGVTEMAVPSKLTTYFSASRPVLAATSADSTTADEVRAAGAGVVVPPGEPPVLLDAAVALAGDDSRVNEMGANGLRYCREVLAEHVAIEKYDTWVRNLASTRTSRERVHV